MLNCLLTYFSAACRKLVENLAGMSFILNPWNALFLYNSPIIHGEDREIE
jgi:hypothetical protein